MIRSRAACRDILIFSRNGSSRRRTTFNTSCITSKTARVVRTSVNSGGGATGRGAAQSRCILMSDTRQHDQHDAALSKPSHNIIAAAPTTTVRYYSALPFRSSSKACVLHHTDPSCTTIAYTDFHPPWPARPAVARAAGASITSRRCMATTGTSTVDDERERNDIPTKPKKRGRPRKPKAAEQHTGSTSASAANTQSSANTSGAKNKVATLGKPRRQGKGGGKKRGEGIDEVAATGTVEGQATGGDKRCGDGGQNENPAEAGNDLRRLPQAVVPEAVVGEAAEAREAIGGCDIEFDIGRFALLADGALMARRGDTVVTVSAVSNRSQMDEGGFLPLSVEYREKAHATGKIPKTRDRREGQPTDAEVLVARAVDRVLRPLFPPGYCFDTQIIANVQALAKGGDPVVLAINAASAALCVSNIPWDGPAACVRIGRIDGKLVVNPPPDSFDPAGYKHGGGFDLLYAGNEERALMIEMGGGPMKEADVSEALALAHSQLAPMLETQRVLMKEYGRDKDIPKVDAAPSEDLIAEAICAGWADVRYAIAPPLKEKGDGGYEESLSKAERGKVQGEVLATIRKNLAEECPEYPAPARTAAAEEIMKRALRMSIIEFGERPDGRQEDETRPLTAEADVLPTVHGSGMFTRGETQTLATVALGPPADAHPQRYLGETKGDPEGALTGRMYLHYEFPPYCTNEIGKLGGTNRRMVGHGNLAERAILPVMPDADTFPYTTRVLAEVTMSNGSSSMATACATSLALMDAGVPLSGAVAGISVGLMTTEAPATGNDIGPYKILLDLQGTEDHYGDMDFKVAGTAEGITAIQLDVKLRGGVPLTVLDEAIKEAKNGREKVLEAMNKAIPEPSRELKPRAPRCEVVCFEPERKGDLVGLKGQTLRTIEAKFGVQLDLSTEGKAVIFSEDAERVDAAVKLVRELVHEIVEGELLEGKVTTVYEYGCLVELLRNQQGLLHVSNMTDRNPAPPARELVQQGQPVLVRVIEVDRLRGHIKLNLENSKLSQRPPAKASASSDGGKLLSGQ